MLEQEKLADVMVVSTMDRQHVGHAIPALRKGYNILMEKPISPELDKCKEILEVAKDCPGKIIVCHVLRYTTFYNKLKELISSGRIGDVVSICANENVGYWHQAHSFVRGNWRNSQETSPMILQKSCHDMDILTWLLGKKCKAVSSFSSWMSSVLSVENTMESTYKALREGPYGRCVYHCDNDVVDHQQTNLLMEDGSTISFTMCAFTESCYRYFKAMGTQGEIEADMLSNIIHVREFGKEEETIDVGKLSSDLKGHGGGDSGIIQDFLEMLLNDAEPNERTTTLEHSMESHFIALAAEESRLHGGQVVDLEAFKQR